MMQDGTKFEDAVALYYFDFDVRNLLNRYISRIEVAFRTYMTYYLSNKYANDTTWFVNPSVVSQTFCDNFETTCYISIKKMRQYVVIIQSIGVISMPLHGKPWNI